MSSCSGKASHRNAEAQPSDAHEPPLRVWVSMLPHFSDAGFAGSARFRRRSVIRDLRHKRAWKFPASLGKARASRTLRYYASFRLTS
jgi:hypothetical protein